MKYGSIKIFSKYFTPFFAFILVLFSWSHASNGKDWSNDAPLYLFLDANVTHRKDVAAGIELGLKAGLAVGAERFGGTEIIVAVRDHRGNMRRTATTIDEATENPNTLAMVGGMQSPHYIKHGATINERRLVLLLPWSAGASLTRLLEDHDNHIFRVSVDDRKAGSFLAEKAVAKGCKRVAILALDDGWGRANARSVEAHAATLGAQVVHSAFIRRDAQADTTAAAIAAMAATQPDCTILVLTARGTALAANELAAWASPPFVLSHWGILGGGFTQAADHRVKANLDIGVLATCALERVADRTIQFAKAFEAVARIQPGIKDLSDIASPIAFAHAYDIGLLLRAAVQQAQRDARWNEGKVGRSTALRNALEALETPVDGLLKLYQNPFGAVENATSDGHEALGQNDLCLVSLGENGELMAYKKVSHQ